jgi:hypothetical protein
MSALGQNRTLTSAWAMSALLPKAGIRYRDQHVRFVPEADIDRAIPYRSLSTAPARQIAASIAKL